MTEVFSCQMCAGSRMAGAHIAREMLLGHRTPFAYHECAECRSVQIAAPPADLATYYPTDYYSYDAAPVGLIKRLRQALRCNLVLFAPTPISAWAAGDKSDRLFPLLRRAGVKRTSRILDIGCGGGALLRGLARAGLPNLLGVDPFIESDIETSEGVKLVKRSVREVRGQFDLIMFNHSLEHVPSPAADLAAARELLAEDGCCLVRVPLVGTFAWREYGIHWYGLDAPRHLTVPSRKGIEQLATRSGFGVEDAIFDSTAMQFMASELYRRDIPLAQLTPQHFTRREIAEFRRRARALNAAHDGDQGAFLLRRN